MSKYQRDYINDCVHIDGRNIPYPVFTAHGYLEYKHDLSEEEIEDWAEKNYEAYNLLTQIIALKQSCFLLRHTGYSCGTLSESLLTLRNRLINELEEKYGFIFDNDWMEQLASEVQRLV